MHKILATAALAVFALSSASVMAQPRELPSQADIAARHKETLDRLNLNPVTGKDIQAQMRSNTVAADAASAINSKAPVSQASKEDFQNLVRPGERAQPSAAQAKAPQADLMIFVSLSMPDQMLEQYAAQAKRFNAVLMMRGFVNDKMSDTKTAVARLNKSGAQWEINPEPFKLFKIDKVPAVVMATADSGSVIEEGCAKPETYTVIFGDMSVLAALDKMSLRGQKAIAGMAKSRITADRQSGKTE